MTNKALDTALQQAQMVAFCVPDAGPILAAGVSIFQAVVDGLLDPADRAGATTADAIGALASKFAEIVGTNQKVNDLASIHGWASNASDLKDFIRDYDTVIHKPTDASDRENDILREKSDINGVFDKYKSGPEKSRARVENLDLYFSAMSSYHSWCTQTLMYVATTQGKSPGTGWVYVQSNIRILLERSLDEAVTYQESTVKMLEDNWANLLPAAQAKVANMAAGPKKNAALTRYLRSLKTTLFLDAASEDDVKTYRSFLDNFGAARDGLKKHPLGKVVANQIPTNQLGPRAPRTARFLYETALTGEAVAPFANSPVAPGLTATQVMGNSESGSSYYQLDTAHNPVVAPDLQAAVQLVSANQMLKRRYDARYGQGAYAADSVANPATASRLTSLLIPLSPAPPMGDDAVVMMYSVGPKLDSANASGIIDEAAYKQIYKDALTAIQAFNNEPHHPSLSNLRVTLLSTESYAGASRGATLNAQAAKLVVDSVVEVLAHNQALETFTILINTDDKGGGAIRVAFDAAATARSVIPLRDGFDIPLP